MIVVCAVNEMATRCYRRFTLHLSLQIRNESDGYERKISTFN